MLYRFTAQSNDQGLITPVQTYTDILIEVTSVQCSDLECTENISSFSYDWFGEPKSSFQEQTNPIHRPICSKTHANIIDQKFSQILFKNVILMYFFKHIQFLFSSVICLDFIDNGLIRENYH